MFKAVFYNDIAKGYTMKQHMFRVDDAMQHGLVSAVILSHIRYHVEENKKQGKNYHDGRYWYFNSIESLIKILPYLGRGQAIRALKQLESDGVIVVGNYNKKKYDYTKWYSIA